MKLIIFICITGLSMTLGLHLLGGEAQSNVKLIRRDITSSGSNDDDISAIDDDDGGYFCSCTFEMNPVCGSNGETYSSPSCAECYVTDYTYGPCEKDKGDYPSWMSEKPEPDCCKNIWDPVCGTDDTTYSNANCAVCKGSEVAFDGMCNSITPHCVCSTDLDAVCGIPAGGELTVYASLCISKCQSTPVEITDVDMDDCVGSAARTMVLLPD